MVVVKLEVIARRGRKVGPAIEAGRRDQLTGPAIEAFHYAVVCGWRGGARQCSISALAHALTTACLPLGFFSLVTKRPVNCELWSVNILVVLVGDEFQTAWEIGAARLGHMPIHMQGDAARSAVNGDK